MKKVTAFNVTSRRFTTIMGQHKTQAFHCLARCMLQDLNLDQNQELLKKIQRAADDRELDFEEHSLFPAIPELNLNITEETVGFKSLGFSSQNFNQDQRSTINSWFELKVQIKLLISDHQRKMNLCFLANKGGALSSHIVNLCIIPRSDTYTIYFPEINKLERFKNGDTQLNTLAMIGLNKMLVAKEKYFALKLTRLKLNLSKND